MIFESLATAKPSSSSRNLLDDPFSRKGGIFRPIFRPRIHCDEPFFGMFRGLWKILIRASDRVEATSNHDGFSASAAANNSPQPIPETARRKFDLANHGLHAAVND